MKKVMLIKVMMIALIFTGCQQDEYSGVEEPVKVEPTDVEKSAVRVSFSLSGYGTYASTEEEDKENGEITVNGPLELYVFSANGPFYGYFSLTLNGSANSYTSEEFYLPTGDWYMYAFINKPSDLFPQPGESTNYMDFELQKVKIGVTMRTLMGTLVREKKTIYGGGTAGSPERISLQVGHLLSKVDINTNDPVVKGNLKGAFVKAMSRPYYMIGNRPTYIHLIGQWEGPFRRLGSQVTSPHYTNYVLATDFDVPLYPEPSIAHMAYYTRENTNKVPRGENSSCFIIKYRYDPHPDEVHDANHETGNAHASGETFWVAYFEDGQELIYNTDPTLLTPHPVGGPVLYSIEHVNAECFYRVFIADESEKTPSLRYATIRNHFYYLTVNSISGLGTYPEDNWTDEEKPLTVDKDIDVTLTIENWIPYEIPVDLE